MNNNYSTLTLALAAGAAVSNMPNQQSVPIAEQPLYSTRDALQAALREQYPGIDFDSLSIGPGSPERLARLDRQVRESGALDDETIIAYLEDFLRELADHAPEAAWAVGLNALH